MYIQGKSEDEKTIRTFHYPDGVWEPTGFYRKAVINKVTKEVIKPEMPLYVLRQRMAVDTKRRIEAVKANMRRISDGEPSAEVVTGV